MKLLIQFPAVVALTAASPIQNMQTRGFEDMGILSNHLSKRLSISVVENQLGECKPVTVIFARGTFEIGNVGALVGPPFFQALELAIGDKNVGVQGVDYPASLEGYLEDGDAGGATKLASLCEQAASLCPSIQIVLSGYSQGAQIVHNGLAQVSAAAAEKVAAVVLFGDPFKGRPLSNIPAQKVKTFCFVEDLICKDTIFVSTSHLSYAVDAGPAALFVKSLVVV